MINKIQVNISIHHLETNCRLLLSSRPQPIHLGKNDHLQITLCISTNYSNTSVSLSNYQIVLAQVMQARKSGLLTPNHGE
jgi:hypothetical protein